MSCLSSPSIPLPFPFFSLTFSTPFAPISTLTSPLFPLFVVHSPSSLNLLLQFLSCASPLPVLYHIHLLPPFLPPFLPPSLPPFITRTYSIITLPSYSNFSPPLTPPPLPLTSPPHTRTHHIS